MFICIEKKSVEKGGSEKKEYNATLKPCKKEKSIVLVMGEVRKYVT